MGRFGFSLIAMVIMSQSTLTASESPYSHTTAITTQHIKLDTKTSYEDFVMRLDAQLGRNDPSAYESDLGNSAKDREVEKIIKSQEGSSGFVSFAMLDFGKLVTLRGQHRQARQYLIGNPLIAVEMAKSDIRAGLYAPLRVLVYADASGNASVEYDLPSSLFGQFGNAEVDKVAHGLDSKISTLIETSCEK